MSEREIREAIQRVTEKLEIDHRARAMSKGRKLVYPLMVGATVFVASCDDDPGPTEDYGVMVTGTETGSGTGAGAGTGSGSTGTGTALSSGGAGGASGGASGGADSGTGGLESGTGGAGGG